MQLPICAVRLVGGSFHVVQRASRRVVLAVLRKRLTNCGTRPGSKSQSTLGSAAVKATSRVRSIRSRMQGPCGKPKYIFLHGDCEILCRLDLSRKSSG